MGPERRGVAALTGAVVFLVAVLVVSLIYKAFRGDFSDSVEVTARVGHTGDSLTEGDVVTYRDVIVGSVTSYAAGRTGARLTLRIEAPQATQIPAAVTALAVPESLFGSTKIVLVPPRDVGVRRLSDGDTIAADTSPSSDGLQTALSDLYTLLTAVRPAELDGALTALATALRGRGELAGQLVDHAAAYLDALAPSFPQLHSTIHDLATVTLDIAHNAPALIGSLSNALTPAAAIVRRERDLAALLAVAPGAADDAAALVARTGDDVVTVISNAQPVLQAIDDDPGSLGRVVLGFRDIGAALNSVIHDGRARIDTVVAGANTSALLAVLAGQKTDVADSSSDPAGYTALDCPRYPGAAGPDCEGGTAAVISDGGRYTGTAAGAGTAQEQQLVRTIAGRLAGVAPASLSAPVTDLILGPVLRGTTVVLK